MALIAGERPRRNSTHVFAQLSRYRTGVVEIIGHFAAEVFVMGTRKGVLQESSA